MLAQILAAIAAIGTVVSGIVYLFKFFKKTPQQKKEEVEKEVRDERKSFEDTGRPT